MGLANTKTGKFGLAAKVSLWFRFRTTSQIVFGKLEIPPATALC